MQQTKTKQVAFTQDNITKCQCTSCPVQASSDCAMDKTRTMQAKDTMPSPEDAPKVYCSTGKATCTDLDLSKQCVCPTCSVWSENALSNYKYCQNGSAAVQG
jgi:hypothetical protein